MANPERDAYLRGEANAEMRLGGTALVDYLHQCAVLRIEPDPRQIASLVIEYQVADDEGPDCLGAEGDCVSEHVSPCPLAQAHATFDASDRIVAGGEVIGHLVAIDGEWFVATGLGWKSRMAAVQACQQATHLQSSALRAIRACRDVLTETARYEVLEALVYNDDEAAARLWHTEALGFDDGGNRIDASTSKC